MAEIQRTTKLTAKECRAMAVRLQAAIGALDAAAAVLDREDVDGIWVFKVASYRVATEKLKPFVEELQHATLLLVEGNPQDSKSRKKSRKAHKSAKKKSES